jgi:hypothetical protein
MSISSGTIPPVLWFASTVKPSNGELCSIYEIVYGMMIDSDLPI